MKRRVRAALVFGAALVGYALAGLLPALLATLLFFLLISGGDTELVLEFLVTLASKWEGILLTGGTLFVTGVLVAAALSIWGRRDAEGRPRSWDLRIAGGVTSFVFCVAFYYWVADRGGTWMQGKGLLGDVLKSLLYATVGAGALRRLFHRTMPDAPSLPSGESVVEREEFEEFQPRSRVGLDLPTSIVAPSLQDLRKSDHASAPTWRIEGGG